MNIPLVALTEAQYDARVTAHPESVFYRYTDKVEAVESYSRKFANPRFDNDELFVFEVSGCGYVVQTTGSLIKAGA